MEINTDQEEDCVHASSLSQVFYVPLGKSLRLSERSCLH